MLERHGVALRGIETDTMLASYLLDATRSAHPLEDLALEHAGYKALREEDLCGRGAKAIPFAQIPAGGGARLRRRAGGPGAATRRARFATCCARKSSRRVYRDLELPLIPVLVAIERAGIRIDGPALAAQSQHVERELASRSAQIFELAGEEFNINSPKQLSEILFDKLQLPALKRNAKTQDGVDRGRGARGAGARARPAAADPRVARAPEAEGHLHRRAAAARNPDTGRVHTCFNQAVAATGRLSSSDPNLQNIPIRTELGREIRRAFIADRGHVLISADYSQIELRVLAHLSGDEALVDAFRHGEDIHDRTALKVFGADQRPGRARAAPPRQDHQLRAALRQDGVHAGEGHRRDAAGGAGIHRRVLRRLPVRPRSSSTICSTTRARHRRGEDDVRPAAAGAGADEPQRPDPRARPSARRSTCRSRAPPPTS